MSRFTNVYVKHSQTSGKENDGEVLIYMSVKTKNEFPHPGLFLTILGLVHRLYR